ncbi:pirin family protein [Microvirgula aerodenitrificans]|uniref:pirin family protein n=1 Tax=Microvirgula aerodenitrificans TaxID=57480 RepID=UPI002F3F8997
MLTIRRAEDRGVAEFGWLSSRHTFSFGQYRNPRFDGYSDLLVINDDVVSPGQGFGRHGHRDMEIISYVLDGQLEHRDSLGNGSVMMHGDVQRMSAGTGVMHSEFNASESHCVHFYQIWIQPDRDGYPPSYEQTRLDPAALADRLALIAAPAGEGAAVAIHQDARLHAGRFSAGARLTHALPARRRGYLQLARGTLTVNGLSLDEGDGLFIEDEARLDLESVQDSEVLLFDLR